MGTSTSAMRPDMLAGPMLRYARPLKVESAIGATGAAARRGCAAASAGQHAASKAMGAPVRRTKEDLVMTKGDEVNFDFPSRRATAQLRSSAPARPAPAYPWAAVAAACRASASTT